MLTIAHLARTLQPLLTTVADQAAATTGFVRRHRKLTGARFVQTCVLGWLHRPAASVEDLTQTAAACGVAITDSGLDQRFSDRAAACLRQVLEAAVQQVLASTPVAVPLLQRFTHVEVQDSTIIRLPAALAEAWPGSGSVPGQPPQAALKAQVRLDLVTGALCGPELLAGTTTDRKAALASAPVAAGAVWLADLGFYSLEWLAAVAAQQAYWLLRLAVGTRLFDRDGTALDLLAVLPKTEGALLDRTISLGATARVSARLIARRRTAAEAAQHRKQIRHEARESGEPVSARQLLLADWDLCVTNVPRKRLKPAEALVLIRVRWQIELLFKLWKSEHQVDAWRSTDPWRILCEIYAKLIGTILQHWILLIGCWAVPDRSWVKANRTIRAHAVCLALAQGSEQRLQHALAELCRCLAAGCRITKRATRPSTIQQLLACSP